MIRVLAAFSPLLLLLALIPACAATSLPTVAPPQSVDRAILSAAVPGWYRFCVEDPDRQGLGRIVCDGTVEELRHRFAHLRRTE